MAFIISNIEPFDTAKDAEVAAEKLGEDYEVYEVDDDEIGLGEDEFDDEDLDDDEEEDIN